MEKIGIILTKRQKIVIASAAITIGLLMTQLVNIFVLRYQLILGLALGTAVFTLWALWEGMTRIKAGILLILPILFSVGVSFYFIQPSGWTTRLPVVAAFGVCMYFLLLSQNVFNVSSSRTIPLYRAASTANFLFTVITAFFAYNMVYVLHAAFYWNALLVALLSFPLILQVLWSIKMDKITMPILLYSGLLAVVVGEAGMAFSFWPLVPTMWSLSLGTILFVLLGIIVDFFREQLDKRVVLTYLLWVVAIGVLDIIITSWAG